MIFATLMGTSVEVHSDLACPGKAAVSAEFLKLGLDEPNGTIGDRAILTGSQNGDVVLTLTGPEGESLGKRTFSRPFECDEVARAIALTVAIWESNVHPEYTPLLAARERKAPAVPAQDPSEKRADPPTLPVAEPRATPSIVHATQEPTNPSRVERAVDESIADSELGVGASAFQSPTPGNFGAEGIAFGFGVVGIHRPRTWPVGMWLSGNVEENRVVTLPLGVGEWRRTRANAGVLRSFRLGPSAFVVDGRGGLSAARLTAKGVSFATNFTDTSFDLGVEGGIRLSMRHRSFVPWIDFSIVRWLSSYDVLQSDPERSSTLPGWLFGVTLGVSLGWKSRG